MSFCSSRWCTAFTVPAVPTGINIGVCIRPWLVVNSPARALESLSFDCILKNMLYNLLQKYGIYASLSLF